MAGRPASARTFPSGQRSPRRAIRSAARTASSPGRARRAASSLGRRQAPNSVPRPAESRYLRLNRRASRQPILWQGFQVAGMQISARRIIEHNAGWYQMMPSETASSIHGMTSSSISSRVVSARKPRSFSAFAVPGMQRRTSCSGSESFTTRNRPPGLGRTQMRFASSITLVEINAKRFRYSILAAGWVSGRVCRSLWSRIGSRRSRVGCHSQ